MVNKKVIIGIGTGIVTLTSLFLFLSSLGFQIIDITGNLVCAGNLTNPCISEFQVKNPTKYNIDIYNPNQTKLDFIPEVKDYVLFYKDGTCKNTTKICQCTLKDKTKLGYNGWRCIDFTNATKKSKTTAYNFRFPAYSTINFRLVGFKNNPNQDIKWTFETSNSTLDPWWYSISGTPNISTTSLTMELGSQVNITANLTGYSGTVCVDIDHPSYGINYSCGTPSANFLFNITYFRNNQFNDSSTIKNISFGNCYQESANSSSGCGDLDTGTYSVSNNGASQTLMQTYFNINYSKPVNANNIYSEWIVKHGDLSEYPITILPSCWNYNSNKLILRIVSENNITAPYSKSYPQCYNGSWNTIGSTSVTSACCFSQSGNEYPYFLYDGNWSSYALGSRYGTWLNSTSSPSMQYVYEEAMNWKYDYVFYIKQHQYDEIVNASINISGYISNGTYPTNVKLYINNTLSNNLGLIYSGNIILNTLNDSSTIKNISFDQAETNIVYLKIPKNANILNSNINLSGFKNYDYCYQESSNKSSSYDTTFCSFNYTGTYTCSGTWDNTGYGYTCDKTYDENWDTLGMAGGMGVVTGNVYINYSKPLNINNGSLWRVKDGCSIQNLTIPSSCLDYNANKVSFMAESHYSGTPSPRWTKWYCLNSSGWGLLKECSGQPYYVTPQAIYEEAMIWNVSFYPLNSSLEVGTIDGTKEWNYTGNFNVTNNKTSNFNTSIMTYLSSCTQDSDGYCNMPLYFISLSAGIIQVSDIQINYTSNLNPVYLNTNLMSSFLGNSTNFANIPIKFESTQNGTLQIDDIRLDYRGGNDTIEIKVHNSTYTQNETINITVFYSDWDYSFPYRVNYLEFIPKSSNSKNVTPYGQTSLTPIFNITMTNYGGRNANLSIYLNESMSCVNLSASTQGNVNNIFYSDYSCYQETANVSTICGGLNNGSYSPQSNYLYINYSKPSYALNSSLWQVKYGGTYYSGSGAILYFTNLTIDNSCFSQPNLQFRFYTLKFNCGSSSYPQCYNGTNWVTIGNVSNGGACRTGATQTSVSNYYDGNWNTGVLYNTDERDPLGYVQGQSDYDTGTVYEEAMIWDISSINSWKLNNTWQDIFTNKSYLSNQGIWFFADYSCNFSYFKLFNPDIYLKNCCYGCDVCSNDLI